MVEVKRHMKKTLFRMISTALLVVGFAAIATIVAPPAGRAAAKTTEPSQTAAGAQTTTTAQTQTEPVSPSLDPAQADEIDKIFAPFVKPDSPGCSVAVLKDGRIIFARGYGWANLEYDVPITPQTVFEAGSVSKQFTAAAILILAAEGKLGLEDDIRKHLPEVPDFGRPITLRHLLTHTSGLRDQWNLLSTAGRPMGQAVHTPEEILDLVSLQQELNFQPGDDYLYCNTGYALAAWVVQRVAGQTLADFSRERIFRPLGMNHTKWRDDFSAIVKGRATAYSADNEGRLHQNMPFTNVCGNGGLLTTASDLLLWAENFWNPRVVGRESLNLMEVPATLKDGTALAYALGLRREVYRGLSEISHAGSTAGYRAFLARYPDQHTAFALLSNFAGVNPIQLARKVADVVLAGHFKDTPKPLRLPVTAVELKKRAGLFISPKNEAVLRLDAKNGKLLMAEGRRERELVYVGANRFVAAEGGEYVFEPGAGNKPDRWLYIYVGYPPSTYTRANQAQPTPQKLAEYSGRYWSAELEVFTTVAVKEGRLVMSHRPTPTLVLEPTDEDGFLSESGEVQVRFRRDESGRVEGFSLSSGRVIRLKFSRV
jgi:CubicO group peptidase (beta-lactamase class C family)